MVLVVDFTVKLPVLGSNPTWTLCTKLVGLDTPIRGDLE